MNLRQNKITIQELLDNPAAAEVIRRRFPKVFRMPVFQAAGTLTLEQVLRLAAAYVPKRQLEAALQELKSLP